MEQTIEQHQPIRHQQIGNAFNGVYYVENSFIKLTVQNKPYTDMMLRDRSGSRNVKYWGELDVEKGDFVFVAAIVEEYMGGPSVVAKNVERRDPPEDLSDYIPCYEDHDEYASRFDELRDALRTTEERLGNHTCGKLVDEVYSNQDFFAKFLSYPGSEMPHYGCRGGLLANTVRVADACWRAAESYGLADFEKAVLLGAAMLHKAGGVDAYSFQDCMPCQTKRGVLLGINQLTFSRVSSALRRVVAVARDEKWVIDQEAVMRILHAVSSYDSGCVEPMTKEAVLLSSAYKSDAQMVHAVDFIEEDPNEVEEFTAWDPRFRRRYYRG